MCYFDSQEMGAVPGVYIPPERQQNKVVQSCFPGHILHQRAAESNCSGQPLYCPSLITAPNCKSLPRRMHYLLSLPGSSPSLLGDGCSASGGSWGPMLLPPTLLLQREIKTERATGGMNSLTLASVKKNRNQKLRRGMN